MAGFGLTGRHVGLTSEVLFIQCLTSRLRRLRNSWGSLGISISKKSLQHGGFRIGGFLKWKLIKKLCPKRAELADSHIAQRSSLRSLAVLLPSCSLG